MRWVPSWARRLARRILGRPEPPPDYPDEEHPERLAVLPYCVGRGVDVGCGHRKTTPDCIGIDVLAAGERGRAGVMDGVESRADVQASGDDLHMFRDGELDFVIARHNLEHYGDPVRALREWRRVLRAGGYLALVVPDDRYLDTLALDPTHKHAFTPDSLRHLIDRIGGFHEVECRPAIPGWSFLYVARRSGGEPAGLPATGTAV